MSDTHSGFSQNHYFAAGVFKIDSMSAGFPELEKIAQEWVKDEGFYSLLVRKVSEDNYGIQFIYYKTVDSEENKPIKMYKKELQEKYGSGFYAWDYNESVDSDNERHKKMLIVSRELKLD